MIIIMKQGTTHEHVEELSQHIERWNVKANPIYGEGTIVIGLVGDTGAVDKDALMLDPQVENIIKVQERSSWQTASSIRTTLSLRSHRALLSAARSWSLWQVRALLKARSRSSTWRSMCRQTALPFSAAVRGSRVLPRTPSRV